MIEAASFRRTLFLTRVPKGTGRFLMRRLASLIYIASTSEKRMHSVKDNIYIPKLILLEPSLNIFSYVF
jgi:hypothetical protein